MTSNVTAIIAMQAVKRRMPTLPRTVPSELEEQVAIVAAIQRGVTVADVASKALQEPSATGTTRRGVLAHQYRQVGARLLQECLTT